MADMAQPSSRTAVWIEAMRPRTLPLAIATVSMGSFLAAAEGTVRWPIAALALLTAVLLQILSNLANDYGDSVHGADHSERAGPPRAVQSGLIAAHIMRRTIALFAFLSITSGLSALWLAFGSNLILLFIVFVILGGAAIGAAITYTAGSKPYGYAGLGDLFVFLFFGWIGVIGSYYLQVPEFNWALFLPATSTGLLIVAVLNVNNIRDIDSDRQAGKLSIPVRLGGVRARRYHWALLITAVVGAMAYVLLNYESPGQLLFLLTLPLLWRNGTSVSQTPSNAMDPLLRKTSLLTLLFVLMFGTGLLL
jgi:1,4-dihydroxy-2-naphthoate octaprenyltransferase